MRLTDLSLPDTPATRAATEALDHFCAPVLVHHCWRSAALAAARARLTGLVVDEELLLVAALLHDLALEPAFDSHTLDFEVAGGALVWLFTAGAGWEPDRRGRCAAAVVAHMRGTDPEQDPEGHLLDLATGLDISGRGLDDWPAELVADLLERWPRLDLAERFGACAADQARRKPTSTAARMMADGWAERIAGNPLDRPPHGPAGRRAGAGRGA